MGTSIKAGSDGLWPSGNMTWTQTKKRAGLGLATLRQNPRAGERAVWETVKNRGGAENVNALRGVSLKSPFEKWGGPPGWTSPQAQRPARARTEMVYFVPAAKRVRRKPRGANSAKKK